MSIHWYAHHLGDYDKKTKTITLLEHGAYRLLLDYYYSNGGPFANDLPNIYRACHAHTPPERRAVSKMLSKYFSAHDGIWCQPRCDEEIAKRYEQSDIAREKANKRWKVNMPQHEPQQCKPTTTTNNHRVYKNGGDHGRAKTSADAIAQFTEEQLTAAASLGAK